MHALTALSLASVWLLSLSLYFSSNPIEDEEETHLDADDRTNLLYTKHHFHKRRNTRGPTVSPSSLLLQLMPHANQQKKKKKKKTIESEPVARCLTGKIYCSQMGFGYRQKFSFLGFRVLKCKKSAMLAYHNYLIQIKHKY